MQRFLPLLILILILTGCSGGPDPALLQTIDRDLSLWENEIRRNQSAQSHAADYHESFFQALRDTSDKLRYEKIMADSILNTLSLKLQKDYELKWITHLNSLKKMELFHTESKMWFKLIDQQGARTQQLEREWAARRASFERMKRESANTRKGLDELSEEYNQLKQAAKTLYP